MKECAAQWKQMKAAKQTGGKTYREFSKTCMSGSGGAAPSTAAAPASAPPPAKTTSTAAKPSKTGTASGAKPSEARQAMYARERACGADWKAEKAAGKVPAGMKWPQYWSACNKRKKAAGM